MCRVGAWAGAGMISAVVFVIGTGAGAATDCKEAGDLLQDGLVEDAKAVYVELIKGNPPPECALQGVRDIAERRSTNPSLELGSVYEAAGKYEEARALYVELLREDPTWTEARDALTRAQQRPSKADDPFAAARSLATAGDDAAAAEALRETVTETGTAVPENLEYLLGGKPERWREARVFVGRWWEFAAFVLTIVLSALIVVYLLLRRFGRTYLEIQDFDKGTTGHDIGKGLSARVKEELKQLNDQGRRPQVTMVSGPLQKDAFLAELTPLAPQAAVFWQVIDRLLPRNVATVTGHLHESDGRGGLTLTLTKGQQGQLLFSKTIWEDEFRPSGDSAAKDQEPYRGLLEPTAIWILYHLHRWSERPRPRQDKGENRGETGSIRRRKDKRYDRLGATDWYGYALFRAGVRQATAGEMEGAREMYEKALDRDAHNRGALFNQGYLVGSSEKEEDHVEALKLLRGAKMGAEEASSWETETVWYLSSYWIAATQHYRNEAEEAREVARKVYAKAKGVLEALEKPRSWWPSGITHKRKPWELPLLVFLFRRQRRRLQRQDNEHLREWLEKFEPLTLVMYGAILASQKNENEGDAAKEEKVRSKIDELAGAEERPPRLSYNLACYYSVLGDHSDNNTADDYTEALRQLERSFKDGGHFTDEAAKDPSLSGVRDGKDTEEQFTNLLKKYRAREEVRGSNGLPLARLAPIGKGHAERLEGTGVVHGTDLIEKVGTPEAREAIAAKLDVSPVLLERWALLADLMRVPGIDAGEAGLLDWARVGSLDALKESDAEDLANLLEHLTQARLLTVQPPKADEVRGWIEEANKLQPQVRVRYRRSKYPAM